MESAIALSLLYLVVHFFLCLLRRKKYIGCGAGQCLYRALMRVFVCNNIKVVFLFAG